MVLKTRKTGFTNQLLVEFTLQNKSFPSDVPPFYSKSWCLASKIRGKQGNFSRPPSICICGRKGKSIGRINDYTQTINSNQMKIPLIDSETLKLLNVCKKFAGNKKPN